MSKFTANTNLTHDSESCVGVLVTNLGTPDAPTASALRKYLAEFLSDPRVVEAPRLIWWFILHGFILRFRPSRSAEAYQKVWAEEGSPLMSISKKQAAAIQKRLKEQLQEQPNTQVNTRGSKKIHVELAMRYGNPSIKSGMEKLRQANAKKIIILPLYPQYSASTSASTLDAVSNVLKTWRNIPELKFIKHYHDHPDYIAAVAASIREHWEKNGRGDKLVFSFHGIPQAYFDAGDPYYCECHKSARLITEALELDKEKWVLTFQSRFGPKEWLKPYNDETLVELGKNGCKSVDVVCPGFSADCLETLEEINMQNKQIFLQAGGEKFSYIPALNDRPDHIAALSNLIQQHL